VSGTVAVGTQSAVASKLQMGAAINKFAVRIPEQLLLNTVGQRV
jgi:hypothetical protein